MAGSYPDAPGPRIAYDADGTYVARYRPSTADLVVADDTIRAELNTEGGTSTWSTPSASTTWHFLWVWPEFRHLYGAFIDFDIPLNASAQELQVSEDTTNGIDGSWDTVASFVRNVHNAYDDYRDEINVFTALNTKGVRFIVTPGTTGAWPMRRAMFYGEIVSGETPQRLRFIDGENNPFLAPIDYGDVARGSMRDRTFRLENLSPTHTAEDVIVSAEALFGSSNAWLSYRIGGSGPFTPTVEIESIGPEATSPLITVRQTIPGAADARLESARTKATVTAWTT